MVSAAGEPARTELPGAEPSTEVASPSVPAAEPPAKTAAEPPTPASPAAAPPTPAAEPPALAVQPPEPDAPAAQPPKTAAGPPTAATEPPRAAAEPPEPAKIVAEPARPEAKKPEAKKPETRKPEAKKPEAKKPAPRLPTGRALKRPTPPERIAGAAPKAQPIDPYATVPDNPRTDPAAAYKTGLQQYARGDTTGALATFRTSLSGSPNFAPTWRGLGLVYEKLGNKAQARSSFQRYLQLAPNAPDADQVRDRLEHLDSGS